jgi:putative transposase
MVFHPTEVLLAGNYIPPATISAITDKVWPMVESLQNCPLELVYAMVYLDALHIKLKRDGKIAPVAVYNVLGVDLDGHREIFGHWIGDANFWLSVITDIQNRGVHDIFLVAIDGLPGFKDAIHAVFPKTRIQRCIIHKIRNSLKYVVWKDQKAFMADLKTIYQVFSIN